MKPSIINPNRVAEIIRLVSEGNTRECAFSCAGVSPRQGHFWLRRGREAKRRLNAGQTVPDADRIFLELAEGIRLADGKAEAKLVELVRKAAEKDWRAAMAMLKARRPEVYSERRVIQHQGRIDLNLQQAIEGLSDEQLTATEELLVVLNEAKASPLRLLPSPDQEQAVDE